MINPSPVVRLGAAALCGGVPLLHAAKQVIDGQPVTQKMPSPVAIYVLTSASSTDTGAVYIRPFADMNLGRLIPQEQPPKPGQEQLPTGTR